MGERADEVRPPAPRRYSDEPIAPEEPTLSTEPVEGKDPEEIRADIERTREEMGETIDAIQERISPENIKENVRQQTVGRVKEVAEDVSARVKETGSKLVDRAEPYIDEALEKAGPLGEQAEEQLQRGRVRYEQLRQENPRVVSLMPVIIFAVLVLLWLLRRRGSDSSEPEEILVYTTRVYETPEGHFVTVHRTHE